MYWKIIIPVVIAYLLGNISPSIILGKIHGIDIKKEGSGNAGTTNALRVLGKKAAFITLVIDIGKGVLAVIIGRLVGGAAVGYICALAVFCGHIWPCFYSFKGGKGVATAIGVLLMLNWKIGLICLGLGIIIIALTKMVSLGSMCGAILFPILSIFMQKGITWLQIVLCFAIGLFVIYNHRTNIKRIKDGKENKLSFKSKK